VSTSRIIPPEVFDELRGHHRLSSLVKKLAGWVALAAVGFVLAVVVLRPGSNGGSASVSSEYRPTAQPQAQRPAVSTRETGALTSNPVGRLVVDTELPEDAWLEIDGRVFTSGLGIDFPLRVLGDTTHKVAVHARGYTSWQSDVYVAADSLVRLSVTIEQLRTPQPRSSPTQRVEEPQPEPQQVTPPLAQPSRTDRRPPFPDALRDSLILILEEGRVLHQIGRYFDAADQYRYVLERVAGASVQYRSSSVLDMLRARADSAMQAARLDCRSEGQEKCP
jgi:hypothetical protein